MRSLQTDNLKLYEKVRYMHSYRENTSNSTLDPLPSTSSGTASAGDMNKYHARYEEAMNPFEAFRGRVSCDTSLVLSILTWLPPPIGSRAGILQPQPTRARRVYVDEGGLGQQARAHCVHLLRRCATHPGYVYGVRLYDILNIALTKTATALLMTFCHIVPGQIIYLGSGHSSAGYYYEVICARVICLSIDLNYDSG
jgi:hypothetical protein